MPPRLPCICCDVFRSKPLLLHALTNMVVLFILFQNSFDFLCLHVNAKTEESCTFSSITDPGGCEKNIKASAYEKIKYLHGRMGGVHCYFTAHGYCHWKWFLRWNFLDCTEKRKKCIESFITKGFFFSIKCIYISNQFFQFLQSILLYKFLWNWNFWVLSEPRGRQLISMFK